MATIKFRRGALASIPTLAAGEPGWATDTQYLYVGTGSGNIKIAKVSDLHPQSHTLASHSSKAHSELTGVTSGQHHAQLHGSSHQWGGGDAIRLDNLAATEDNTDLNATTTKHGLLLKLGGGILNFLRADGAWAVPQIAAGVPSGLIAIFDAACPDGWTRVSAFDSKFLRGYATYGVVGGSVQHRHSHDHPQDSVDQCGDYMEVESGFGEEVAGPAHDHTFNLAAMQSSYATGNDHLPPYINVVFCKKD